MLLACTIFMCTQFNSQKVQYNVFSDTVSQSQLQLVTPRWSSGWWRLMWKHPLFVKVMELGEMAWKMSKLKIRYLEYIPGLVSLYFWACRFFHQEIVFLSPLLLFQHLLELMTRTDYQTSLLRDEPVTTESCRGYIMTTMINNLFL